MSETTPENPPTGDETPTPPPAGDETPTGDEGTPTPAPADETPGEESGGGGDVVPPPVILPGSDYSQGVDTLYGELTDEANTPRWAQALDELTHLVATTYDEDVLAVAYELAGSEPESRSMARDAAQSLLLTRITEALQGARAVAELEDQGEPPAPGGTPVEG